MLHTFRGSRDSFTLELTPRERARIGRYMRYRCRLHLLAVTSVFALWTGTAAGQTPAEPSGTTGQPAADTGFRPKVSFQGFADINWSNTSTGLADDGRKTDGFTLGNLVGHVSASLGGNLSFYTEVVVSPRVDAAGFDIDLARAIVRYDFGDHFKLSAGRYHAPVSYWNTAFHRGTWLQTTIFRPDIVKEQFFQPDHFEGVIAEGVLWRTPGLGYAVGFGNGREADLFLMGDNGGNSTHQAYVAKLFLRPPQLAGVEFGGAGYRDTIAVGDAAHRVSYPEWITSGYVAITKEAPELIAEFSLLRHHDPVYGLDYRSHAFYVQGAWRFPQAPSWKPYVRFEKAVDPDDEPVFGALTNSKTLVGLRYELTDYAALKIEGSQRRQPGAEHVNGVFVQAAVTF